MDEIRTAEMFCGVGGFRLGLERASPRFRTVWANDIDRWCCQVYRRHWGDGTLAEGGVEAIDAVSVPDHDLLTAGFPCQSFSLAGKRAGFDDTRGTLFFEVARVLKEKRPRHFLLENVKGLLSNKSGETFQIMLGVLADLGYLVQWQVLNSKHFGVPQNRERVFVVGHLGGGPGPEVFPVGEGGAGLDERNREAKICRSLTGGAHTGGLHSNMTLLVESALIHSRGLETRKDGVLHSLKGAGGGSSKNFVVRYKGDWFSQHAIYHPDGVSPTLRGGQHNPSPRVAILDENIDGKIYKYDEICPPLRSPNTIWNKKLVDGTRIRRLTPVECERLQGFPDGWTAEGLTSNGQVMNISDTQRYKAMGNAVTVNVVEYLGRRLLESIGQDQQGEAQ